MNTHPEIQAILDGKCPWPREQLLFAKTYERHWGPRRDGYGRKHFKYDFIPELSREELWHWLLLVDYACLTNSSFDGFDRYEVLKVILESAPRDFSENIINRVEFLRLRVVPQGNHIDNDWLLTIKDCVLAEELYVSNQAADAYELLSRVTETVKYGLALDDVGIQSLLAYLISREARYLLAIDEAMCLTYIQRHLTAHPKALTKFLGGMELADLKVTSMEFQAGLCIAIEEYLTGSSRNLIDPPKYTVVHPLVKAWSQLQPQSKALASFIVSYLSQCDADFAHAFTSRISDDVRDSPHALKFQERLLFHVLNKLREDQLGIYNRQADLLWRVALATKTFTQSQRLYSGSGNFLSFAEESMILIAQESGQGVSPSAIRRFVNAYDQDILNPYSSVPDLKGKLDDLESLRRNWAWIYSNQVDELVRDPRHVPFKSHVPCNLEVLKILLWATENSGSDVLAAYEKGLVGACPIHACSLVGIQIFLREYFRDATIGEFTSKGMTRLQTLILNCQPFELSDQQIHFLTRGNEFEIHPWQWKALHSWAAHARTGIISAATGAGKSLIGTATLLEALEDNYASWLLVHRRILKSQWYETAFGFGNNSQETSISTLHEGVVKLLDPDLDKQHDPALKPQPGEVLVALPISLQLRKALHPHEHESNFVLVDEVHNFNAFFRETEDMSDKFSRKLGISATIDLRDHSVLHHIGQEVFDYQLAHAIEDKVVAGYKLLCIRFSHSLGELDIEKLDSARLSLKQAQVRLNDAGFSPEPHEDFYHAVNRLIKDQHPDFGRIAYRVAAAKSAFDAYTSGTQGLQVLPYLAPYLERNGHALLFSNSRSVGQEVTEELTAQGVKTAYLDGEHAVSRRMSEIERLKQGEVKVLVAPQVLDEGIDIPSARTAVILGVGNYGYRQVLQRAGRVLRRHDAHTTPVIIITAVAGGADDPNLGLAGTSFGQLSKHIPESAARIVDFENLDSTKADLKWVFSE